ncbi:MAG: 2-hydroxyacyl-CoA dehydratase [Clostridia bacterium]|nr:2-hydroxyacyl-CoA dehydratase [Clostridia bacterium]
MREFPEFTKEMRKTHTILVPDMLEIHFELLVRIFRTYGYTLEVLKNRGDAVKVEGLKYVHNDTCFPALLVIGQMINALKSGKYDISKTALMITQTGGGCRASNYIHLLRKALIKAGFPQVPVISLNLSGLEKNSGFKLTFPMLLRCFAALVYGDTLMLLRNQTRPYEVNKGSADALVEKWLKTLVNQLSNKGKVSTKVIYKNINAITEDFAQLMIHKVPKVKVGIVGEIYVKYSGLGNNDLEAFLASQGCEYMVPGLMGFMMFKVDNRIEDIKLYGGSSAKNAFCKLLLSVLTKIETAMIDTIKKYPQFVPPAAYVETKALAKGVIGYGSKMGEGWLLTAEMIDLVEMGYGNIVCAQPFGCLPNHIVGKGMIRKICELHPSANIVPIDYDPGATHVNQENRIKLMLSIARENMNNASHKETEEKVLTPS